MLFILRAIATIGGTAITVGTLFVSKFNYIRSGATALSSKSTSQSRIRPATGAGSPSSTSLQLSGNTGSVGSGKDSNKDEVERLNKANKKLKHQVKSLELKVTELEAMLKANDSVSESAEEEEEEEEDDEGSDEKSDESSSSSE